MNERIIELADKAVEDISSGPWNISDEFCGKFAEMIVRECAEIADTADATREKWESIGKYVRQHFGVKE